MRWQDDSAMKSKMQLGLCSYQSLLIGSQRTDEPFENDGGLHIYDGKETRFGTELAEASGSSVLQTWCVPNVGMFVATKATAADVFIQKITNPDDRAAVGTRVFTEAGNNDILGRSFVDCGWHTLAAGDRHVLLYFQYGPTDLSKVWVSKEASDATAGASGTWTELFAAPATGIDHFHGGVYIKGKGLYVFTGDGVTDSFKSSICFAAEGADFIDLIDTPATWYAADHWSLADRSSWAALDSDFVVGAGDQVWRTVDLVTSDGRNAYYIQDSQAGSISLNKLDLYDTTDSAGGTLSVLKSNIQNVGWYGGTSKSGMVYLSTITYADNEFSDGNSDIWAIDPEDDSFALVKQTSPDQDPFTGWFGLQSPLFEYGGAMFGRWLQDKFNDVKAGEAVYPDSQLCGYVRKQKKSATNILAGIGSFESGDQTGWYTGTNNNVIAYDAGEVEILANDTVTGSISGATADVLSVDALTSGSWAGDNAVGLLRLKPDTVSGVFEENELLKVDAVENATINGIATLEVLPDPTGQLGGNVLRIVSLNRTPTPTGNFGPRPDLTSAQKAAIEGDYITYSCKLWVIEGARASDDFVNFKLYNWADNTLGSKTKSFRRDPSAETWNNAQWVDIHLTSIVPRGSSVHQYRFMPDDASDSGDYLLAFVTDFQIVKGSLPNRLIAQLSDVTSGFFIQE